MDDLLFDLDGTLTDPAEGITNAAAYALERFGIRVADRRTLTPFIGPPLIEAFRDLYGMDERDARRAQAFFREYYEQTGIYENVLLLDIPYVLETLTRRGKRLLVATSKPEPFARRILERFHLADYFTEIAGAAVDDSRVQKADVIAYALAKIRPSGRAAMIGDRKHDVIGAKANGLYAIGVLYGFGSREELTEAGADALAETPRALLPLV